MKSSHSDKPLVVVISGPSGVGKDVVIDDILDKGPNFHHVVTATTRQKRKGEKEGVDYYFLSSDEFEKRIEGDKFLEYAQVYGNYYGVLRDEVERALRAGKDVILKVDVQGAETLRKKIPDALFIFLAPASIDELLERMKGRNADSEHAMRVRMGTALREMEASRLFHHCVVNYRDDLPRTVKTVKEHIERFRRLGHDC